MFEVGGCVTAGEDDWQRRIVVTERFLQIEAARPPRQLHIHDGELEVRFPQGDPRNDPISRSKIYFGSRDLFRTSFALNRDVTDKWGVQVMFEHLSHGQVLGEGRNQGIDNVGVRVFYRLGE